MKLKHRIDGENYFIAYARASSRKNQYTIQDQLEEIEEYAIEHNKTILAKFSENKGEDTNDLTEREKAIKEARKRNATLVVTEITRLTREVLVFDYIRNSEVRITAIQYPNRSDRDLRIFVGEAGREILEQEEDYELAREEAIREGRPFGGAAADLSYRTRNAIQFANSIHPIIRSIRRKGITTNAAIARELNELGVKTRRKGKWQSTSVKRILEIKRSTNSSDKKLVFRTKNGHLRKLKIPASYDSRMAKDAFHSKRQFMYWATNYLDTK